MPSLLRRLRSRARRRADGPACEVPDWARRDFYLYLPDSPAIRAYGREPWRHHDDDLGGWTRQAILHQPKTYALTVWRDVRTFFVPSARRPRPWSGGDLDAEVDWTAWNESSAQIARDIRAGMRLFFDPFLTTRHKGSRAFLHDYQRIFRFGATALTLATGLSFLGLLIGPRRNRVGVLLFGIGGLAMLVGPTLSVYAIGRYTVTAAPLIAAGGALTVSALYRMERERHREARASVTSG